MLKSISMMLNNNSGAKARKYENKMDDCPCIINFTEKAKQPRFLTNETFKKIIERRVAESA